MAETVFETVADNKAGTETQTRFEDLGGGDVRWRTYINKVLDSDTLATAAQLVLIAGREGIIEKASQINKRRNARAWMKNAGESYVGLNAAQRANRIEQLFAELLNIGIEQGWFD